MDNGDGSPIPEPEIEIEKESYEINYIDATADKDKAQSFYPQKNLRTYVFDSENIKQIKEPLKNMLIQKSKEKYTEFEMPKNVEEWNKEKIIYVEKLNKTLVKTMDHSPLNPRIVSGTECPGYYIERIIFNSEYGISIPGLLLLIVK